MKDAGGHGSETSGGSAKAAPYRAAVAGFSAAAGKWAANIVNAQADLAAHQSKTEGKLKSTADMMAEHDKIWGTNKSTNPRSGEDPRAAMKRIWA